MKNKAVIIGIIVAVLIVGASAFYFATKDKDDTKTANDSTSTTTTDSPEEKKDVRQAVWEQFSPELQEQIDWKQGKVSTMVVKEDTQKMDDPSYVGKEVYVVEFMRDIKAVPNNTMTYADMDTFKIVGGGLMD